jgi:hypothetical protein
MERMVVRIARVPAVSASRPSLYVGGESTVSRAPLCDSDAYKGKLWTWMESDMDEHTG